MRGKPKMVIGIGGNIGSGKTTAAKVFADSGAHYISADEIGWQVLKKITNKLEKKFGSAIMNRYKIDKMKLRNIVFSNPQNLKFLNKLSHPILIEEILRKINKIKSGIIVIDAALLFNWSELCAQIDYPILIAANSKLKKQRAIAKGIDKKTYHQILKAQKSEKEMARQSKFIIENNGTLTIFKKKCRKIYEEIKNDC